MLRAVILLVLILTVSATIAPAEMTGEIPPAGRYVPGEILVKFRPAVSAEAIDRLGVLMKTFVKKSRFLTGIRLLSLDSDLSVEEALEAYRNHPDVVYAEPNYIRRAFILPDDPNLNFQWGVINTGQVLPGTNPPLQGVADADIDAPEAWSITTGALDITTGLPSIIVAVIDSGIDYTHPDLASNMWTNNEAIGDANGDGFPGIAGEDDDGDGLIDEDSSGLQPWDAGYSNDLKYDDDENGYVDDINGWNFVDGANPGCLNIPSDPMDDFGHGTHVAGTIGAEGDNGVGVTGVMWRVQLMALKVIDCKGDVTDTDFIEAIGYAVDQEARIVNASLGGPGFSQALHDAVAEAGRAGILVVAAAGNDGTDNDDFPIYPANLDLPNVISVGASDFTGGLASFSNFGNATVDVAAPGDCVYSTLPSFPAFFTLLTKINSCTGQSYSADYDYLLGTSMAVPYVAGVAGLLLSQNPSLTPEEVRALILLTADPGKGLKGRVASSGQLNALNALRGTAGSGLTGGDGGCGFPFGTVKPDGSGPNRPIQAIVFLSAIFWPLFIRFYRRRIRIRQGVITVAVLATAIGMMGIFWPQPVSAQGRLHLEDYTVNGTRPVAPFHSVGFKLGYHRYDKSEYFDTNSGLLSRNDLSGLSGEMEYDWRWHDRYSLSITGGRYGKETDLKNVCCAKAEWATTYLLLSSKYYSYIRPIEWSIGAGIGFYHSSRKISGIISDRLSANVAGVHGLFGVSFPIHPRVLGLIELRYAQAKVKSAGALDDSLDVGGLNYSIGFRWLFKKT